MELKFKNIKYNNIINNLSVSIKSSEITAIIGNINSKAYEILNLIYGMHKVDSGSIIVNKHTITSKTSNKILNQVKNEIAYLSSEAELFNINVLEDLKYGLTNYKKDDLLGLLKDFNLDESILKKNYTELSNGEKKKILIISVLLKKSKIILLDNPTLYLDKRSVDVLIKILKNIKRENKIIIIYSNDSEFLLQVSDRILVLDNKSILFDNNKYEILSNEELLSDIHMNLPNVLKFENMVLKLKNVKLGYRDNINDLIKDIYRNVK